MTVVYYVLLAGLVGLAIGNAWGHRQEAEYWRMHGDSDQNVLRSDRSFYRITRVE